MICTQLIIQSLYSAALDDNVQAHAHTCLIFSASESHSSIFVSYTPTLPPPAQNLSLPCLFCKLGDLAISFKNI